jgi:hypothetical protein
MDTLAGLIGLAVRVENMSGKDEISAIILRLRGAAYIVHRASDEGIYAK